MKLYYLKCSHIEASHTNVYAADEDCSKLWHIGRGLGSDLSLLTKYNEKCWNVEIIYLDIFEDEFIKLMKSEGYLLQP